MNPIVQAQVASAQKEATRIFDENPKHDLESKRILYGRDLEMNFSAEGDIATAQITDRRPKDGPSLGQVKQSGSPLLPSPSTQSWGKPASRG